MKYTVFYKGSEESPNMAYSFCADSDQDAIEFCKSKFTVSTEVMTIVENLDVNLPVEYGRLVYNNGKFLS